jgi:transposase
MIMKVQNTIQDGYDYALGYVASYGPVRIQSIRMHLQFQTTLSALEIDSAVLQVIEQACEQYDNQVGAYWLKD